VTFYCSDWWNPRNILVSVAGSATGFKPSASWIKMYKVTAVLACSCSHIEPNASGRTQEDDLTKSSCDLSRNWIYLLHSTHGICCVYPAGVHLFSVWQDRCLVVVSTHFSTNSLMTTRDSSVSIVMRCGLDGLSLIPGKAKFFSSSQGPDLLRGPASLLSNVYCGLFLRR
jgi:hypothetical protein